MRTRGIKPNEAEKSYYAQGDEGAQDHGKRAMYQYGHQQNQVQGGTYFRFHTQMIQKRNGKICRTSQDICPTYHEDCCLQLISHSWNNCIQFSQIRGNYELK